MKYLITFLAFQIALAQQYKTVNFKLINGKINFDLEQKTILGNINYQFKVLSSIDTIKIDAKNTTFSEIKLNSKPVNYLNTGKQLLVIYPFKKGKNELTLKYIAKPKQALYFTGNTENKNLQIWTQGQGKYTSNWFPSFDNVNQKSIFNLEISFDSNYEVISNGILKNITKINNQTIWTYEMNKPMSSYLLMLAIGNYKIFEQKSQSKVSLLQYIDIDDTKNYEPTYRYSKVIFDFLEKKIGYKYPWKIYKQAPVHNFLYAGMENTTATLFSNTYIVDSIGFIDKNYVNVNAHELAHQWFGNLVTAENSTHHWLQEGFATYYALLSEKEIFGEDYFYTHLYETAQQLKMALHTDTIPLLNSKASSLTFYEKGAWALHALHEEIGEEAFKKSIKNYLKKYAFKNVNTNNFLNEVNKITNYNLTNYIKVWLESSRFNSNIYNNLLLKNKTASELINLENIKNKPLSEKYETFEKILKSDSYFSVKEAVIYQLKKENFLEKKQLLLIALQSNELKVRQAVANILNKIPEDFIDEYETLLEDKSYKTQEIALYYLWRNFPEKRTFYLDKTQNWKGFNDFNLRILWLYLTLQTPESSFFTSSFTLNELISYSSNSYEATIRQNALEKLLALGLENQTILCNLVNLSTHHSWQFSKYGKETIKFLLKNKPKMQIAFKEILPKLNESEKQQLNILLKECN